MSLPSSLMSASSPLPMSVSPPLMGKATHSENRGSLEQSNDNTLAMRAISHTSLFYPGLGLEHGVKENVVRAVRSCTFVEKGRSEETLRTLKIIAEDESCAHIML